MASTTILAMADGMPRFPIGWVPLHISKTVSHDVPTRLAPAAFLPEASETLDAPPFSTLLKSLTSDAAVPLSIDVLNTLSRKFGRPVASRPESAPAYK